MIGRCFLFVSLLIYIVFSFILSSVMDFNLFEFPKGGFFCGQLLVSMIRNICMLRPSERKKNEETEKKGFDLNIRNKMYALFCTVEF